MGHIQSFLLPILLLSSLDLVANRLRGKEDSYKVCTVVENLCAIPISSKPSEKQKENLAYVYKHECTDLLLAAKFYALQYQVVLFVS